MTIEITVPEIAESVSEAVVSKWYKQPGDSVKAGEVLLELETDKINLEVNAPQAGTVTEIKRAEGAEVRVGDVLGVMAAGAAKAAPVAAPAAEAAEQAAKGPKAAPPSAPPAENNRPKADAPAPEPVAAAPKAPRAKSDGVAASALARKLAESYNLSLETIRGTGPGGQITRSDVILANSERDVANSFAAGDAATDGAQSTQSAADRERVIKLSKRRITIMQRLSQVQKEAVMTTTYNEVDMSEVIAVRKLYKDYFKDKYNVGLGITSFFVKAVAMALGEYKIINSELRDNQIVLKNYCNIGVAVASDDGLVVPVINDADKRSFVAIEQEIKRLIVKTRQGKLELSDLLGGTFTITNGGVFGSLMSTPIINPPQAAILGLHGIKDKPVVADGAVAIRPMMYLAVTYDHRFIEGGDAIKFLVRVRDLIEQPALLLIEG